MAITWKTYRKHNKLWNTATSRLNQETNAEDPEHFFVRKSMDFDPSKFLHEHKGNYSSRNGLNLQDFYLSVAEELMSEVSYWCDDAVEYMKANHPWNNRTHAAEEGLGAMIAGVEDDRIIMYLYHSVYYGEYLERRGLSREGAALINKTPLAAYPRAGYIGVIPDTLQRFAPVLMKNLQGIMNRS